MYVHPLHTHRQAARQNTALIFRQVNNTVLWSSCGGRGAAVEGLTDYHTQTDSVKFTHRAVRQGVIYISRFKFQPNWKIALCLSTLIKTVQRKHSHYCYSFFIFFQWPRTRGTTCVWSCDDKTSVLYYVKQSITVHVSTHLLHSQCTLKGRVWNIMHAQVNGRMAANCCRLLYGLHQGM